MATSRISASSYSNTAPLVWSFIYGQNRGNVEIILDNAPARSAELLAQERVDAALVPIIAYQTIENVRLIPRVCVGARMRARSVGLITKGCDLADVRRVSLDTSSRTSVALTKIIFREFLRFEPEWQPAAPNIRSMLASADAALLIGDPSLAISSDPGSFNLRYFDLAELWHRHTGLGFVFAMWMTRAASCSIDFAGARDEGLDHIDEIIANYRSEIKLDPHEMFSYLTQNISYTVNDAMQQGLELYFRLAHKHLLIDANKPLEFAVSSENTRGDA